MKFKREHLSLFIFIAIVIVIGYVLVKYIALTEIRSSGESAVLMAKPIYLLQTIPKMDKLKTILDNPKFKEMTYIKDFFIPVEVTEKGRPNPFMPFKEE